MKQQFTRWSPDTCDCKIVYTWDSDVPSEKRVHKVHEIEYSCHDHEHLLSVGKGHHYDTVLEENQRKNIAYNKIGTDKKIKWQFTGNAPNRTLHILDSITEEKIVQVEKQ